MTDRVAKLVEMTRQARVDAAAIVSRQEGDDAITQEARIMKVARTLPADGELSIEHRAYAREAVGTYLRQRGITISAAARGMRVSPAVLSQVLLGTYEGNQDKYLRQSVRWMEGDARGSSADKPVGLVMMQTVQRIMAVAVKVHELRDIGIVIGQAGRGKTMTAEAIVGGACPSIADAIHVEVPQTHTTPKAFLELVAAAINCRPLTGSISRVASGIYDEMRGRDTLLIVDDAHWLQERSLLALLDIHKQANIPILVLGTEVLDDMIDRRLKRDGQFTRHVKYRYRLEDKQDSSGTPVHSVDEIRRVAESMSLRLTDDALGRLTELACIPGEGGIDAVIGVLARAAAIMRKRHVDVIDIEILDKARQHGYSHAYIQDVERRRELMLSRLRVRTA